MEKPKVSVIIPVYNTEKYVQQAVESILLQTICELEIIVINDGSTDNSLNIVKALAQTDQRIQVYEQENRGQSVARNTGLNYVTGQYVYFMDSDDLLEIDALEQCYKKCEEKQLDFVFFDATILNRENKLVLDLKYNRSKCIEENRVYTPLEIIQLQLTNQCYTPSPCLNFIRAEKIQEHKLSFFPGIIHEDQLFNGLLYFQTQRTMYIHRSFFKRRIREGSTMTSLFGWKNIEGYLIVARELLRFAQSQRQEIAITIDLLLKQMLNAAVYQAYSLPLNQRIQLLAICLTRYPHYISLRTLAILLLKSTLNKK